MCEIFKIHIFLLENKIFLIQKLVATLKNWNKLVLCHVKIQWNIKYQWRTKTKEETNCPFAIFFLEFTTLLMLILRYIDHTLWPGRNASLLVLKDLQPSKSKKTNRPSLGIVQKEILGYLFSQRKTCWAGHVVRRATKTAQPSL